MRTILTAATRLGCRQAGIEHARLRRPAQHEGVNLARLRLGCVDRPFDAVRRHQTSTQVAPVMFIVTPPTEPASAMVEPVPSLMAQA